MSVVCISFQLAGCKKPKTPVTETSLIGKWSAVELMLAGNRGPSAGIIEAHSQFFTNYTTTGMLKWTERSITNAEVISWSGNWKLQGDTLQIEHDTNLLKGGSVAGPQQSVVWHEADLLVMGNPQSKKPSSMTIIFKRVE